MAVVVGLSTSAEAKIRTCENIQTLDDVMKAKNITHTRMKTIKKGFI